MSEQVSQSLLRDKVSWIPDATLEMDYNQIKLTVSDKDYYFHNLVNFDLYLNSILVAKVANGGVVGVLLEDYDYDDVLGINPEDFSASVRAFIYQESLDTIKKLDGALIYNIEDLNNGYRVYTEGIGDNSIRTLSDSNRLQTWVHGYVHGYEIFTV